MDLGLTGKIALVTGASRGLGAATALEFAREGATVILSARREEALAKVQEEILRESDGQAETMIMAADLTKDDEVVRLLEASTARFGRLDMLVANCGGPPSGRFEDHTMETWHYAVDIVLLSVVRLIRAALPALRRSEIPSILTISANSGRQPIPNMALSGSIRLAVVGLTKTLALELGPEGIRVNSILPAWTMSEAVMSLMTARAVKNGTTVEEEIAKQAQESALGRLGTVEEFARAAVFLCSPAVPFMTGTMMSFDGGIYKAAL